MKYRVIIEDRAAADIEAHALWILEQGSPIGAERWVDAMENVIASSAHIPERCPIAPEAGTFQRPIRELLVGSHRILFLVDHRTVHVLHVRHAARRGLSET